MLASTIEKHTDILEKLQRAREELHEYIRHIGKHHNCISDGNGKYSLSERKMEEEMPRPAKKARRA
jgi:hypothetical protein